MLELDITRCELCPLNDRPIFKYESNITDLDNNSRVDLFVLTELSLNTGIYKNDLSINTANDIFREVFVSRTGLNKYRYFIINTVLCSNIVNGKSVTSPIEAVRMCSAHWKLAVEKLKPRVLLVLGSTAMNSVNSVYNLFDEGLGITKVRGRYMLDGMLIVITFHPSYIMRQPLVLDSSEGQIFLNDFYKVKEFLDLMESQGFAKKVD